MNSTDYLHYRNSTIGQALTDALDDMIQTGTIQASVANRVLGHFDRAISAQLSQVNARGSFRGSLSTYRNCDDVWTFILRDVTFKFDRENIHADKVKIIACKRPDA
ncbi:Transcription initiation factor IIA subunit 2 [Blastocladiella emersonii ATCC 22665]|nr:Transcription initiation factor IIA subunit 2 [Blastocladiella emersonii ATCC 22665]